jgi:transcription initiation factor TFIIB
MGAMSSTDRNLITAFKGIDRLADAMSLPSKIANQAKDYYKQVETKKSLRGRSGEAIIAATIYISCRMADVPRTFKEVAANTEVPMQDIKTQYNYIKKLLKLNEPTKIMRAENYMDRFVSNLSLPVAIGNAAAHVATKATDAGYVAGKVPISVAAAAIYFILQLAKPDQKRGRDDIAAVTGVSESTIRQSYKDMYPHRHKLMPPKEQWAPYESVETLPPG